jgi:hypothetical protein
MIMFGSIYGDGLVVHLHFCGYVRWTFPLMSMSMEKTPLFY